MVNDIEKGLAIMFADENDFIVDQFNAVLTDRHDLIQNTKMKSLQLMRICSKKCMKKPKSLKKIQALWKKEQEPNLQKAKEEADLPKKNR